MNRRTLLTTSLLAATLVHCAEQRDPIDRVQANALEKAFFVGKDLLGEEDDPEFWTQGTLVDVGYGASQSGLFTSTYAQPVARIKWVVQEDLLVGRLTYELIDGSDGKGAGPTSQDGQVVVAYKIDKHFDIRRAYNPLTGEEMNILEENDRDRPWYEREYIRVDWSKNLNTDAYELDTLSQLGVFGGIKYEALAYYVNDPTHPDAPRFTEDYFDITNKAFATPGTIDLSDLGWGIDSFPACFLPADFRGGTDPIGNCNPVELTIRQSFRRVVDSDYEPMEWDGKRFQAYGAFTTERKGYARNYGMSDDQWRRFISRYNIWQQSHFFADADARTGEVACFTPDTTPFGQDPHRDENGDGTEDECAAVGQGSRCDAFKQMCTLPYADRKVRPIVWHFTKGSAQQYFEPTREAANQWDVAMRSAVQVARYAECMRVENDQGACSSRSPVYFGQQTMNDDALNLVREVDDCRYGRAYEGRDCQALASQLGEARGYDNAIIALAQMDEMVIVCQNPVADSDSPLCGERGLEVRPGDLRYHQINVIPHPQTPSPWGIYTDSHDPLTGETIAASINVWSHVNDLFSQQVIDKVRYIEGELQTEDITEGKNVRDWAGASMAASGGGVLPGITKEALDTKLASFTGKTLEELRAGKGMLQQNPELLTRVSQMNNQLSAVRADALSPASMAPLYEARRARAVGSQLEAELNTRAMLEYAGVGNLPITEGTLRIASPLQGAHPGLQRSLDSLHQLSLGNRGACIRHEAPSPTGYTGLGDILEAKFGAFNAEDSIDVQQERAERMRQFIADRAHMSVILHEMGHSIGMRHNFVSSSDALNYRPQYWQLRTKNGEQTEECTDLSADGECVGPRWFDPVTEEERSQMIWMFMHSSVMDYAGEATQDMLGLGAYDFAAARMFYGDAVAVHADTSYDAGNFRGTAMLSKADNFGGIIGFRWSTNGNATRNGLHYSQLNRNFELIQGCEKYDPQTFKPEDWDESLLGTWHPVLDGQIVAIDNNYTRCKQQPVDFVSWTALRPATDDEAGGFSRGNNAIDAQGRTRVPYGFATDRWADLGNLAVYRHDNGADAYELFNFFIAEQEVNHIFNNYRRNRQSFSVRGAVNRSLRRYNEKMRDGAKGLGLFANIYRDFAIAQGLDYNALWPFIVGDDSSGYNAFSTNVLASSMAFDHFTRMMARPEAGDHFRPTPESRVLLSSQDTAGNPGTRALVVPNGATGYFRDVGIGGRPVENALAEDKGDYSSEFTINAGSYYDKVFSTMLLTESVDNFISDSRRDFTDARYRAVSMADLFPQGYRRWLANNLTNDNSVKGVWARANGGDPMIETGTMYPAAPLGWTSWWNDAPEVCFPQDGSTVCTNPGNGGSLGGEVNPDVIAIDPQVGWEQQKFLIAWTLMYLPENQQRWWLDMMSVWNLGEDSDPGFGNRIELHDPTGRVYIAKTFGKEEIFGKDVQKGIAARMLEYGNELLFAAYETDPGPDLDNDGAPDWHLPRFLEGRPVVRYDPTVTSLTSANGRFGCNGASNRACTCEENRACVELSRFTQVPAFLRQAMGDYGLADPSMRGLF